MRLLIRHVAFVVRLFACGGMLLMWPEWAAARPAYGWNVVNQCRLAGRSTASDVGCTTCHVTANGGDLTAKGQAYPGRVLSVFCPEPAGQSLELQPIDSPQQLTAGHVFTLKVKARAASQQKVVLSMSGLPKGARFTKQGQKSGYWTGALRWKAPASAAGNTYRVTVKAVVAGVPGLKQSADVELQVQ